ARAVVPRVARAARRAREWLPLTNLGLLLLVIAAAAYALLAVPRLDYVLRLVSGLVMALVAGSVVAVAIGAALTHAAFRRRSAERASDEAVLRFEAERGFLSLLRMPSFRFFPLIEVTWTWEEPEGFDVELESKDGEITEIVKTRTRNVAGEIRRRFVVEDGFGLARVVLRRTEARALRVVPWRGELEGAPLLRSLSGGDDVPHPLGALTGDRIDMRRYVPGDPLRLALWKVYARTGELMIRTPERAIAPAVRIAAYLVAAEGDEPPAAAARVAVEGGLLGEGWTFSADGANHPATDPAGAVALISESRRARGTERGDGAGLGPFLEAAVGQQPLRVILFVPATPGPWIEPCLDAVRRYGASVSAVIVTDGVRDAKKIDAPKLDRFLKIPERASEHEDAYTTPEKLAEVARTLASAGGAQVVAVERPTGRTLGLGVRGSGQGAPGVVPRARRVA
ncbi:DUF58 domain-containing protein, partial [Myxococcota bacterium]|nr:DUF58 domain-containing protein [Myxococcota bacterium]